MIIEKTFAIGERDEKPIIFMRRPVYEKRYFRRNKGAG